MKQILIAALAAFVVIFNLGYVFHEIVAADFFKRNIAHLTREEYIIPLIAVAFLLYSTILAYIVKVFTAHYRQLSPVRVGALVGGLIGFLWDGLQGGLIEVATFKMPFLVFVVDSSYHLGEGVLAGVIIALVQAKLKPQGA